VKTPHRHVDRDPDREEADRAGADDRVGDETGRRCGSRLVLTAQRITLRAISRSTISQMMLIEKKSAANQASKNAAVSRAIDRNVPCRCQVSAKTAAA
jgi:hypothetical protein